MLSNEVKRVCKSLTFFAVLITLAFFITSQLGSDAHKIDQPQIGQSSYGIALTEDINYIFPNLIEDLYYDTENNNYMTYPYGFYRQKNLNPEELMIMKELISDLIGIPYEEIPHAQDIPIPPQEKLEAQLDKIDALLGGGSSYAKDRYMVEFGNKGMTYEEALNDYQLMKDNGLDVAFARYFNDYAGIYLIMVVWFLGLFLWNKDRPEGISETLFAKSFSSIRFVSARVLSMTLLLIIGLLLIFTYYEVRMGLYLGFDALNPLKAYFTVFLWLVPTILFIVSLSSLVMILTNNVLLGFLGPILGLVYTMSGPSNIFYNIGMGLLMRYNTIGNEQYFMDHWQTFVFSRLLWIVISLGIILLASYIYELRRGGRFANQKFSFTAK